MLRLRLSLLIASTLLITMIAFGLLADWLFIRAQEQALKDLLIRDLARIQQLYASADLGQPTLVEERAGFTMQFVSQLGDVILPRQSQVILPLYQEPHLLQSDDAWLMVGATPWRLPSGASLGTIRLALDASSLQTNRRALTRSLIASGVVLLVMASALSLFLLRRSLRPLVLLAHQAESVDPANPQVTHYQGPDDEVAELAKALNRSLEGIRQRQQAERDALAEVAHELAAPLSVVAGQLQALVASDPRNERLQAAKDAADELLYTSQDLLTLARGELELPVVFHVINLRSVIAKVVKGYPQVCFESYEDGFMLGSAERMTQVIRNLVRNALQASTAEQTITLRLYETTDELCVDVQDQGHGLSNEEQQKIFDRYHSSKRGGMGVGLTVAKAIVEQHLGTISVQSRLGEGSCFKISFPRFDDQLEDG